MGPFGGRVNRSSLAGLCGFASTLGNQPLATTGPLEPPAVRGGSSINPGSDRQKIRRFSGLRLECEQSADLSRLMSLPPWTRSSCTVYWRSFPLFSSQA